MLSYMSSSHVFDINPSSTIAFANISSHSIGCHSILLVVSFVVQKIFSLMQAHLFIFTLIVFALGDISKKDIAKTIVKEVIACFSF